MALSAARKQRKQQQKRIAAVARDAAVESEAVRKAAATRLSEWASEAKRRAKSLDSRDRLDLLWIENRDEAARLGCFDDLMAILWEEGCNFADPRMKRIGMRYHRFGEK